jgi:hypothetical protein
MGQMAILIEAADGAARRLRELDGPEGSRAFQEGLAGRLDGAAASYRQTVRDAEAMYGSEDAYTAYARGFGHTQVELEGRVARASLELPPDGHAAIASRSREQCAAVAPLLGRKVVPQAYLSEALDYIQLHDIFGPLGAGQGVATDFAVLRTEAGAMVVHAQTSAEVYPAITYFLERLGDEHGGVVTGAALAFRRPDLFSGQPFGELLFDAIGYVMLPSVLDEGQAYAPALHETIRDQDQAGTCGWIVDLRTNGGGNMWPMLAGIGPILGEGTWGSFTGGFAAPRQWSYRNGVASQDRTTVVTVANPYRLRTAQAPVALLTSRATSSSAEAIVVSFAGRQNARRFGAATYGVATSISATELPDGAVLRVSGTYMTDTQGRRYPGPIPPDEYVESVAFPVDDRTALEADPVVQTATRWLREQPACAGR